MSNHYTFFQGFTEIWGHQWLIKQRKNLIFENIENEGVLRDSDIKMNFEAWIL